MSIWYEGKAADGTHVLFTADPYINKDCELLVNGAPVEIEHTSRYRDGGTTIVKTPIGTFHWPAPNKQRPQGWAGFGPQSVTFQGKVLTEVKHGGADKPAESESVPLTDLDALLEKLSMTPPKDRKMGGFLGGYMSALLDIREELKL